MKSVKTQNLIPIILPSQKKIIRLLKSLIINIFELKTILCIVLANLYECKYFYFFNTLFFLYNNNKTIVELFYYF